MMEEYYREIKFRAKTKANGHWVVGSYIHDEHCPSIRAFGGGEPFIVPETLGQFTSMTDKNGKDIYEGDIVEAWSQGCKAIGEIRCRRDGLWFIYPAWQHMKMWHLMPDEDGRESVVVIGNIHDNPELLHYA